MSQKIYDIPVRRIDGSGTTLAEYRGRVMLIVNVASKCGLTPQYSGLQTLHANYSQRGLSVLGFPCNDFAAQEPGTEREIAGFCDANFGVTFPLFGKININSAPRHALYDQLIASQPQARSNAGGALKETLAKHGLLPKQAGDVLWNFEKFVVGREGQVRSRFAPDVLPEDAGLVSEIETALDE
jgi:glutathione peroxidase